MAGLRLRTKFLLSLALVTAGLTCATLLIVHNTVEHRVRQQLYEDLGNSVATFQNFDQERDLTLARSAELLANLPNLKAFMTTRDAATIQDASADVWRLSGGDLLVLADRAGRVVAVHPTAPGFTRDLAQTLLSGSLQREEQRHWWFGGGHLYEVFFQPIYFGVPAQGNLLGLLAIGHGIDERSAKEVSRVASSQVAFQYGTELAVSTLSVAQEAELVRQMQQSPSRVAEQPEEIQLDREHYLATSVNLGPTGSLPVRLIVLKSLDQATRFLDRLKRLLAVLGLVAVLAGGALVFLISVTFTRPLTGLVAGVRALEKGDFAYPLQARGGDEVAELTGAFDRMRSSLQKTQQQLLEAERLATIGRMASSISHDLRHPLTAVLANAEFLCEPNLDTAQREELYREIRVAVDQLTDHIESLLEFSRARQPLRWTYGSLVETVERSVQMLRARPEFQSIGIHVQSHGQGEGWFDSKKLQRVFDNLLLNACQAVSPQTGHVEVELGETPQGLEIRVRDNGPGIPEPIRDVLFQPFVSYGKPNGIGLGLAVVQKAFQDHGGEVSVESTSEVGTVFRLLLPRVPPSAVVG